MKLVEGAAFSVLELEGVFELVKENVLLKSESALESVIKTFEVANDGADEQSRKNSLQ